jgi:hypothetical protein
MLPPAHTHPKYVEVAGAPDIKRGEMFFGYVWKEHGLCECFSDGKMQAMCEF